MKKSIKLKKTENFKLNTGSYQSLRIICLMLFYFIIIFSLAFSASAFSHNAQLKLLAASELENGTIRGGIADLFLELRDGSGNIFIDTYPLSKFDTQLSIRFAKDTACKFSSVDCSQNDFLYTIRARSNIIGGPSAGAAVAVITFAQLNDLELDPSVAMTGTINSGRLIGSVGGVKQKIEGASRAGIKKVLIPITDASQPTAENQTIDMIEYGKTLGVEVVPVSDLEDAIYHFTGQDFRNYDVEFNVSQEYLDIMHNISNSLCLRAEKIIEIIESDNQSPSKYQRINNTYGLGLSLLNRSRQAYAEGSYYSSASQCYSANNQLYSVYLMLQNYSNDYYLERIEILRNSVDLYLSELDKKNITTIPALQTSMIILQRIEDVKDYLDNAEKYNFSEASYNDINDSMPISQERASMIANIAFAIERMYTVGLWHQFFQIDGEEYILDEAVLRDSCFNIINDANTRIQYAQLYIPESFSDRQRVLNNLQHESNFAFCIAKASMIRADVNAFLGAFSLRMDDVHDVVLRKLEKAAEVLSEEISSGRFPILGYSYYEYALTLVKEEPTSALIYSEYALELSNLDIYFTQPRQYSFVVKTVEFDSFRRSSWKIDVLRPIIALIVGIFIGIQIMVEYCKRNCILKKKPGKQQKQANQQNNKSKQSQTSQQGKKKNKKQFSTHKKNSQSVNYLSARKNKKSRSKNSFN